MPIDKPISDIRVSDVLERAGKIVEPATVRSDANLRDAVMAIIKDSETRKVYVVDDQGKLVGTITLETLMRHAAYRMGIRETGMTSFLRMLAEMSNDKASSIMAKPVRVLENELLTNVTKLMVENHLNDLPVVDNQNKLVQELNGLDILKLSADHWE